MLPLLKIAADGHEHTFADAADSLAKTMRISDADRADMVPSGQQTRFSNRVSWGLTYLAKGRLVEKSGRGRFRITARGLEVLATNPLRVDHVFLNRFPEYREFKNNRAKAATETPASPTDPLTLAEPTVTPDERLDAAHRELREEVADDLLQRVRAGTPRFFEHLVVDVLVAMGYGGSRADAAQVVGRSGDDGIDGVIKEDRLGLDNVYVQAKKWDNSVGPGEIDQFVGSLMRKRAHKGVFITSGAFTSGARRAAAEASAKIVLIDGEQLVDLMIDHGVGVADHKTYVVKRVDGDYFDSI